MDRLRTLGLVLAGLAFAGYAVGVEVAYPGRAFSVTVFMLGATLATIGGME